MDPITLALAQNRLDYISRHMGWVMTRTARSPIFNQSHDFSCFIANGAGTLLSQADGIPIHTGGGGFAVRALLKTFGDTIVDGDIFILNDPYVAGGNHLPDWVIACPIFIGTELVAFACNRAHQSDIGGGAAGTYNPEATEIFHEGLRIPPCRLIEAGRMRDDLWQLLLLNSRTPELLDGDLRAMIGSTRIGRERIISLIEDLGLEVAHGCFDAILGHAEQRFRAVIATVPDGRYEASEAVTNDCFEPVDLAVRLALTVEGDALTVDFTGTDGQIKGFKNSSVANTHSAVYMALASYFEPDLPRNEGTFRNTTIIAPKGTMVNPRPPAPMTMCTVFIAYEIVQALWQALAEALPARSCAGWGKCVHGITSGRDGARDIDNAEPFVMYHWGAMPGGGAVEGRDGFGQIGHLTALGALTLPDVETYEQLYPVRFRRQEFRCDGGGPGRYRGGTGIDYQVEVKVAAEHSFRSEGTGPKTAFGANGGQWGEAGAMVVHPADGGAAFEAPTYGLRDYGPVRIAALSPGGGGWGDPLDRDPAMVLRDVRDGVVSETAAAEVYGVVLSGDGSAVDDAATAALRG
jgi:N-methylhydantoinase B